MRRGEEVLLAAVTPLLLPSLLLPIPPSLQARQAEKYTESSAEERGRSSLPSPRLSLSLSRYLSIFIQPVLFMERNYPTAGFGDLGTGTGWSYDRSAKAR
ncbi:hypothetical protein XENOCAPTIV_012169 [Xenoophorus captivus]|uniref:Secreted protein n=1 Tax=Xenoophorus captivus TaxID=1517983 RepID=A0ABV0R3I9_9TELE